MVYMGNIDTDIALETRTLEDLGLQYQAAADTRNDLSAQRQAASDIAYEAQERLQQKIRNDEITSRQQFREEESYVLFCRQKRDDYATRLDAAQAIVNRLIRVYSEQQKLVEDLKKLRHQAFMDSMRFDSAGETEADKQQEERRKRRRHHYQQRQEQAAPAPTPSRTRSADSQARGTQSFTPVPSFQDRARAWYERTQPAIDYANITTFPAPPAIGVFGCPNMACKQNPSTLAPACKCSIRAAFETIPNLDLKRERLRWHPDRFAVCSNKTMQDMAKEVFVVVEDMYAGI